MPSATMNASIQALLLLLLAPTSIAFAWMMQPQHPAMTTMRSRAAAPRRPHLSPHKFRACQARNSQIIRQRNRIITILRSESDSHSEQLETKQHTIDFDSILEMDCFVFSRNNNDNGDGETKLELGVLEESVLQPICSWTTEAAFDDYIEFVVDEEDRYTIDVKDVTIHSLIPGDALSFGSRQVGGGKGPGNPHGEESELLYYIRQEALEGLEVVVKPELEILW